MSSSEATEASKKADQEVMKLVSDETKFRRFLMSNGVEALEVTSTVNHQSASKGLANVHTSSVVLTGQQAADVMGALSMIKNTLAAMVSARISQPAEPPAAPPAPPSDGAAT